MGVMNKMMEGMIKALPVEERKELMLKMMPNMMKEADLVKMTPLMLKKMGELVSLYFLFKFISAILADDELKKKITEGHDNMMVSMPEMMSSMGPMMELLMSAVMPKMMGKMSPMMPVMAEHMPKVMDNAMLPMLEKKPEMKENMLTMMQTVFPHCAENMVPLIEKEKRVEFVDKLTAILQNSQNREEK